MSAASKRARQDLVYALASAALVLGAWAGIVAAQWVPQAVLPGPATVAQAAWEEWHSGRLLDHLQASGGRLVTGFAFGGAVGVVLGLVLGLVKAARAMVLPILEVLRPIPPLAWVPLALIWFGIGEGSKVFLIALTACFPVLVATYKGVRQIDPGLIRAAQSLDVSPPRMLFSVMLPAALPDVVTGLRLGWSLGLTVLVGAELIAASSGLGYMVMDGMNNGRFDLVILGILVLGTAGVLTDAAFVRLGRSRLLRWHAGIDHATR